MKPARAIAKPISRPQEKSANKNKMIKKLIIICMLIPPPFLIRIEDFELEPNTLQHSKSR